MEQNEDLRLIYNFNTLIFFLVNEKIQVLILDLSINLYMV